jgi:hypothetical protein
MGNDWENEMYPKKLTFPPKIIKKNCRDSQENHLTNNRDPGHFYSLSSSQASQGQGKHTMSEKGNPAQM